MLDDYGATLSLDDFTEASATSAITDPGPDPTWYPNPYPDPDEKPKEKKPDNGGGTNRPY